MFKGTLIRSGGNAKTVKGDDVYETAIMYLAPANLAGGTTVCPMSEKAGCIKGCLFSAGRGRMSNVEQARIAKTRKYLGNRVLFMGELVDNLERFERYCAKHGRKPAVRLNGTSDIQWEVGHPVQRTIKTPNGNLLVTYGSIFEAFPEVQFYDYTKVYKRAYRELPANYSLTLSYSLASADYAEAVLKTAKETGLNVSVVFRDKKTVADLIGQDYTFASSWEGTFVTRKLVDGDRDDLRFLDPKGTFIGLYAKGAAKSDTSGFVIN